MHIFKYLESDRMRWIGPLWGEKLTSYTAKKLCQLAFSNNRKLLCWQHTDKETERGPGSRENNKETVSAVNTNNP